MSLRQYSAHFFRNILTYNRRKHSIIYLSIIPPSGIPLKLYKQNFHITPKWTSAFITPSSSTDVVT